MLLYISLIQTFPLIIFYEMQTVSMKRNESLVLVKILIVFY